MRARIRCCVPFCRRTTKAGRFGEWICAKHWPLVPASLKRRRAELRRIARRTLDADRLARISAADARLWERCKRAAVEMAAGI